MNFVDLLPDLNFQKHAAWDPRSHFVDPLDSDATSPYPHVPHFEDKGRSIGRTLGSIGGGIAGVALPALAGAAGAYGLDHHFGGHADFGDATGLAAGALTAGVSAPKSIPVGAGMGALIGEQSGGFLGKKLEQLYSPERQAAERIRRLPANHGLSLIRTMSRTNNGSPEEMEAMKQTYNARRESFQDQARAGVI